MIAVVGDWLVLHCEWTLCWAVIWATTSPCRAVYRERAKIYTAEEINARIGRCATRIYHFIRCVALSVHKHLAVGHCFCLFASASASDLMTVATGHRDKLENVLWTI